MKTLSILVVDDMNEAREVLGACLSKLGHDVTCAAGGRLAIQLLRERPFDLVITDVLMPDVDGMEVIMATRRIQPQANIVVMSGGGEFFSSDEVLNLAHKLGAHEQLTKPFTRQRLLDVLDRLPVGQAVMAGAA